MKRRDFCRNAAGMTLGAGAIVGSSIVALRAQVTGPESEQIGIIGLQVRKSHSEPLVSSLLPGAVSA